MSELLNSFTLPNGVTLKNRIVMAPMTTCAGFYDGTVTQDLIEYYELRAGSIGTIIVECAFVDTNGRAFPGAIGLDGNDKIQGLSKIAAAIKEKGSKAILQVYHGGRMVNPKLIGGDTPIGPSALAAPRINAPTPIALSTEEVDEMLEKFKNTFYRAIKAGFDGVEIHGANTYLIQQFYSPNSNQRTDKWGGNRENRARFPLAVVDLAHEMAKKYADSSFIIGYRFSSEELEVPGIRFADTIYLLEQIALKGIDYVHFSMDYTLRSSIIDTQDSTPLISKYLAMRSETLAKIPVIGVGSIVNKTDADSALAHGYDLIAVGKICIAYPDWADRIRQNETIKLAIDSDKRETLKIPEPLWKFPLIAAMIRDVSLDYQQFKAGVYQEIAQDEDKTFTIDVVLDTDMIKDISLVEHNYTDNSYVEVFEEIKTRILTANSPYVDAIASATSQSEAIKNAVTKAMLQSSKDAILAAGGDPNANKVTDIVIVGSGGAGLAAAIQAHDDGAKIIIVEKMPVIGGNTIKSSAGMNAAGTKFQKIKGIIDSPELFYQETLAGGKNRNNPELLKFLVEQGAKAIDWLADRKIELSGITTTGGMSIDRTHRPENGAAVGGYLISGLLKNLNQRRIEVLLNSSVTEIIQETDKIVGVKIIDNNNQTSIINTKTVIIATGGFSANHEMVLHYRPDLNGFVTTNHKGATGTGIKILQALGADTVDMGEIQIHPSVEQDTSYLISESIRGSGAILVTQNGKRFFNELATRDKVSAAIIALPEKYAYILFDQQVRDENKSVEEYIAKGLVVEGFNLKNLAEKLQINATKLAKTVAKYNTFVVENHDDDFARSTGMHHPLDKAPYYAIKVAPGIHHTMGGVVINTNTEVLNKSKQVIQGVYAVGEVVGGIHGANRIGGNAIADIIIFGVQAGKSATAYINKI